MRDYQDVVEIRRGILYLVRDSDIDRLLAKAAIDADGCWLWTGAENGKGYGSFRVGGITVLTHRFSYMAFVGPIPEGLELDHLCRKRRCFNPECLEPVTHKENIRRSPIMGRPRKQSHLKLVA